MVSKNSLVEQIATEGIGEQIFALAAKIYPICRSITGDGVRQTLLHVSTHIPLEVHENPTGTEVFDWTVPLEWNIRDAYVKDAQGEKIVDFSRSNLHVVSYSAPVRKTVSLAELKAHVHTLPEQCDLIPYRTAYYSSERTWGFCMAHRQFAELEEQDYEVLIDSSFKQGFLTYGEYLHPGRSEDEFLFSTHICHPSMADDNCSGIALLALLASRMAGLQTRYSYRFLFVPGTIGAITWLARNEHSAQRVKHGLVVAMVGDGGGPTYKRSRRGTAKIDRAVANILAHSAFNPTIMDFSPYGYDERQFCSPGFNLPMGLFQRSKFGEISEYHTSADNLEFIRPHYLEQSYRLIAEVVDVIENDDIYHNLIQKCEPQLGRRGLYNSVGGDKRSAQQNMALLWVLNFSDGDHSLLDIAERANLPFAEVLRAATLLEKHGLLRKRDRRMTANAE